MMESIAHLQFVLRSNYYRLVYAALMGRLMKFGGTLFGWFVTPIYKRVGDRNYSGTNILYDKLSPLLRSWFVELSGKDYNLKNLMLMITHERRGVGWCEACFTAVQISLYSVPSALIPLTVIGFFLNAVPRQFYANAKMLIRSLHLAYLKAFTDQLVRCIKDKEIKYATRPVFSPETEQETPDTYVAFRGSHHGGTWSVVVSEGLDMLLSGLEGVVMTYLLTVAFCQFLVLIGVADQDETSRWFPFWAVTAARASKTFLNFVTTENLLWAMKARQTQNELYFWQKMFVFQQAHPSVAAVERAMLLPPKMQCPREPFAFMGTPCLSHPTRGGGEAGIFEEPVMCMFGFVVDDTAQVATYQKMLDNVHQLPWKKSEDMNIRTPKGDWPPPFASQEDLDRTRFYARELLLFLFNVNLHQDCPPNLHRVDCAQNCGPDSRFAVADCGRAL